MFSISAILALCLALHGHCPVAGHESSTIGGDQCMAGVLVSQDREIQQLKSQVQQLGSRLNDQESQTQQKLQDLEGGLASLVNNVDLNLKALRNTLDKQEPSQRQTLKRLIGDDEGYYLAFRVTARIQRRFFHRYTQTGVNDDDNDMVWDHVPCGCKGSNGTQYCDRHYRSALMDLWPRLPVEKVKVALFDKGVEKMRIIFDGKGSDHLNFFRQSRVLESPYTDLKTQSCNYFSVEGDTKLKRRFFINQRYGGCPIDHGWLIVVDPTGAPFCGWERTADSTYPNILYSHSSTLGQWVSGSRRHADVLTVSIKLRAQQEACPADVRG